MSIYYSRAHQSFPEQVRRIHVRDVCVHVSSSDLFWMPGYTFRVVRAHRPETGITHSCMYTFGYVSTFPVRCAVCWCVCFVIPLILDASLHLPVEDGQPAWVRRAKVNKRVFLFFQQRGGSGGSFLSSTSSSNLEFCYLWYIRSTK